MAKLGDVCEIVSGSTPKTNNEEYWSGNLCWITPAEIKDNDVIISDTERKISENGAKSCSLTLMPVGTVLLSSRAPIGKVAIVGTEMYCNQGFKNLICSESIYNKYLYWFLKKNNTYLNSLGRGATFKEISKSIVADIDIPLPPLETQQQIAATLDKVTHTIDLCNAILEKLDLLVKSRFVEMFGDPISNPKGWKTEILSNHLNVLGGYAFKSDLFKETGIPVLRIGNINAGYFRPVNMVFWEDDTSLDRYKICAGDLVMSLTGTVGKDDYGNVCILSNEYDVYYLNQRNAKLELFSSLDKYYLSELLKFEEIKKKLTGISRGVRQANISNKDILNLCVPIPPLALQQQFAAFVEQTDKSKLAVKQVLEKAETLKKALMQEYFG